MRAAIVLAGIAIAGRASASPRIDLEHCTAFDRAALHKAIARALPADTARDRDLAVVVECPDLVTAHLHIEPVPADGAIARSLDLGEVPGDLRLKLLALAVAELVEIAVASPPPPPPVAAPARPTGRTPRTFGDPVDPQHLADVEPRGGDRQIGRAPGGGDRRIVGDGGRGGGDGRGEGDGRSGDSARIGGTAHIAGDGRSAGDRRIAGDRRVATRSDGSGAADDDAGGDAVIAPRAAERTALSIAPHVGLRVYASPMTPLVEVGGELGLPWVRVGVRGAIGQSTDTLGTVRPWLVTATLARSLVCGGAATVFCLVARGEAGLAGVTAHAGTSATAVAAHDALRGYAQLGLAGEVVRHFSSWSAVASVDAAWAEGLVARAGTRDIAALAGFVVVGSLGARWP